MANLGVSVVIPTFNRADLLEKLLESLYEDRKLFRYGDSEVIVIDSSQGEEKERIVAACERYDTRYIEGPDSVRKKRNMGIRAAVNPIIVFEDSDVVVKPGLLNHHAETFINGQDDPMLGGSFGLTEFTGESNYVWNVVLYTTLTDSFSFAKKWPYQEWTIGNNVSFKKEVLEAVHLFEEDFPFRLGADDLDLTYRITHAGYRIKSQPEAVTYHAKDTWKKWKAVKERSLRWGRMEHYISLRHPQIFINAAPANSFIALVLLVLYGALSLLSASVVPMIGYAVWLLLMVLGCYVTESVEAKKGNPFYYFPAKYLQLCYYWGHIFESLRNKSMAGIYKKMSFSAGQTKWILHGEHKRLMMIFTNMIISAVIILLLW